ncbi:MAG: hypothetical protein Kow0080_05710 [Candidatus Promineifilaceae bacterium]
MSNHNRLFHLLVVGVEHFQPFFMKLLVDEKRPFSLYITHETSPESAWKVADMVDVVMVHQQAAAALFHSWPADTPLKPTIVILNNNDLETAVSFMKAGAADCLAETAVTPSQLFHALEEASQKNTPLQKLTTQNRQLTIKITELENRNKELESFAGMVAHDLKNILAQVLSSTELIQLKYDNLLPAESDKFLQRIITSTQKGKNILEGMLVLARLNTQEPDFTLVDMGEVTEEALQELNPLLQQTNAVTHMPPSWPKVWGYRPWIEEIWVNYLSNALKYGGQPPIIILGWQYEKQQVRFWVQDNGPGLSIQDKTKLFEPFQRLHTKKTNGHGLGLYIVKQIVSKLNGTVNVESKLGQGSKFEFTLPTLKQSQFDSSNASLATTHSSFSLNG